MELRTRRLMFTLGGSLLMSLGVLAACSSDSGFTQLPGGGTTAVDSGKKTGSDSGGNGDEQPADDSGTDGGADCAAAPAVRDSNNVFCHNGSDGGFLYCDPATTVCCDGAKTSGGSYPASTCVAPPSKCAFPAGTDGGLPYECLQKSHCAGEVCCLTKGPKGAPKPKADTMFGACGALFFSDSSGAFTSGTACKAACDTGEIELCASDDDCTGGKTCHFINANGHKTGACQ